MSCGCKKQTASNDLEGETVMYLVEYVGESTQFQRVRTSRRGYYRYGGPLGSESRRFYVYPEDIHKFDSNTRFKIVGSFDEGAPTGIANDPLPAATGPAPEEGLLATGLSPTVVSALIEAGYADPKEVAALSDEQLLSIKGIGKSKLASIREALA